MLYNQRVSHAMFKKLFIILMCATLFTFVNTEQASANIITKPITIAAKHVLKKFTKKNAVDMANDIVKDYGFHTLEDLLNVDTSSLDNGFTPVCLDKSIKNFSDCPPEKRAQVKNKLTTEEYNRLEKKVDEKVDTMTNTNTKFGKFLDFFVPIFLVSGATAVISHALDSDTEDLINELAKESLIETGLIKPLVNNNTETNSHYDFTGLVSSAEFRPLNHHSSIGQMEVYLTLTNPLQTITFTKPDGTKIEYKNQDQIYLQTVASYYGQQSPYAPVIQMSLAGVSGSFLFKKTGLSSESTYLYLGASTYSTTELATTSAIAERDRFFEKIVSTPILNERLNRYFDLIRNFTGVTISAPPLEVPPITTEVPEVPSLDKQKDETGKYKIPGIDAFDWSLPDGTPVKPKPDGNFENTETGENIDPDKIDEVVVKPKPEPTPEPSPPSTDLDQLGNNVPKELILALLDMLRSILDYMVRLVTFVLSIPSLPSVPIPNDMVMWFFNVEILGIKVMNVARTLAITALGMGVYRILKKVF